MPKKLDQKLEKATLNLFEGDVAFLAERYKKVGWSPIVRQLVHNHVRKLQEREARSESLNDRTEIDAIATDISIDISESVGS